MTDGTGRPCSVDGCGKPAERNVEGVGALCAAHRKRLQRLRRGVGTLSLDAPALGELSPLEEAIVAADRLLEASAEDDREYEERLKQFRVAAVRWVRAMSSGESALRRRPRLPAAPPAHEPALPRDERLELAEVREPSRIALDR